MEPAAQVGIQWGWSNSHQVGVLQTRRREGERERLHSHPVCSDLESVTSLPCICWSSFWFPKHTHTTTTKKTKLAIKTEHTKQKRTRQYTSYYRIQHILWSYVATSCKLSQNITSISLGIQAASLSCLTMWPTIMEAAGPRSYTCTKLCTPHVGKWREKCWYGRIEETCANVYSHSIRMCVQC